MKLRELNKQPPLYSVHIAFDFIETWLQNSNEGMMRLDLDPQYQRGYVWDREQQISFLEYYFRGGASGKDIYWNCPTWREGSTPEPGSNIVELVDGKQRLEAVRSFMRDELPVFGLTLSQYEKYPMTSFNLIFHVADLQTQKEVVEWYLGMNTGGSVHTESDIKVAKDYLQKCIKENL